MKILVVDDSRIIRNIMKNILIERHVPEESISEAADGKTALDLLSKDQFDLFLLDWNMPGLNGLDLIVKIRAMEHYKETPVIMVTSEAARYNVLEAVKAGVTEYIVKPVTARTVQEKLDRYLPRVHQ